MYCPNCGAPMNSAARVYDRNTVTEEVFYCPKCRARHVRHRWVKGMLAGALCLMLMASGPCIDNSSWFRIGSGQPVMENPEQNVDRT